MEKIIHHVWIGPFAMPRRCETQVRRIRAAHPDYEHRLWTNDNLPTMMENVREAYDSWIRQKTYAFAADVLRIWVVYLYGGIYLDVDFVCLDGLSTLDLANHDVFLCTHGGGDETFPNGVFGMAKGCPLAQAAVDAIHPQNNWCGPSWFGAVVRNFLGVSSGITQEELRAIIVSRGWLSMNFYDEFNTRYFRHDALASWFPENQQKFLDGVIDE